MSRVMLLAVVFLVLSMGLAHAGESDTPKAKADKAAEVEKDKAEVPEKATPAEDKADIQLVGNTLCPVSGKPVGGSPSAPNFYSDHNGYRIGFMCPVCKGKFDSADAIKQDELLKKALEGDRVKASK